MNIDKKIIMGVRNKDADAKKELISLTRIIWYKQFISVILV